MNLTLNTKIGIFIFVLILGYSSRNKMLDATHMCALGATTNAAVHAAYCKTNVLCYASLAIFGCAFGASIKYTQSSIDNTITK